MDRGVHRALLAGLVAVLTTAGTDANAGTVWVYFRDKPGEPTAFAQRERELSSRAVERRRRHRDGATLDARDLPVAADYVERVRATGARMRVRSRWLNAVSVEASPQQQAELAALPFVRAVQSVTRRAPLTRPMPQPQPSDYGNAAAQLELIGIPALHNCGFTGAGVLVGVLDTGFVTTHQAFAGLDVAGSWDFAGDDAIVAEEAGDPAGQDEHGTKVLGLLAGADAGSFYGVAPDAGVLLARIDDLSFDAPIEDDWWVAGLEWLEAQGADIVTGSIGFCDGCPADTFDGQTHPTSIAAGVALQNGVILLNSAGNGGPSPSTIRAPADTDGVITVGSVGLDRALAWDSSRGPTFDGRIKPDVLGPGAGVITVDPNSTSNYETVSGTSFAAPMVAGLVVLLKQAHPGLGPFAMRDLLRTTASRADQPGNDLGWGLVDGVAALGSACLTDDGGSTADGGPVDDGATPTDDGPVQTHVEGGCECGATQPPWAFLLAALPALATRRRQRKREHQP